jgi:hypothetical protein
MTAQKINTILLFFLISAKPGSILEVHDPFSFFCTAVHRSPQACHGNVSLDRSSCPPAALTLRFAALCCFGLLV